MKKLLLSMFLVTILFSAGLVFAEGSVQVFSANDKSSCNVDDTSGIVQLFYYEIGSVGTTAIEFYSDVTGAMGWTKYGDNIPWTLVLGWFDNATDGIAISYGTSGCQTGDVYLGMTTYGTTGATPTCTYISILNNPKPSIDGATTPIYADCTAAANLFTLKGGQAIINPDGSCQCDVPVGTSSWGHIKALYK